jgi:hypothetical protein
MEESRIKGKKQNSAHITEFFRPFPLQGRTACDILLRGYSRLISLPDIVLYIGALSNSWLPGFMLHCSISLHLLLLFWSTPFVLFLSLSSRGVIRRLDTGALSPLNLQQ